MTKTCPSMTTVSPGSQPSTQFSGPTNTGSKVMGSSAALAVTALGRRTAMCDAFGPRGYSSVMAVSLVALLEHLVADHEAAQAAADPDGGQATRASARVAHRQA